LVEGENQLAIELHQCNDSSSDLAFDLELKLLDKEQLAEFAARRKQQRVLAEQEAAAVAADVAVEAGAIMLNGNAVQPETQQYYFSDGEVTYHMADGRTITQRSDAIQQISQSFPYIRFARALGGDTVEKMAAQYGIDPVQLRLTNRLTPGSVFRENEVVCLRWRHRVMKDESLASLAKLYNMDPITLRRMNELSDDAEIKEGQVLNVAGRYDHQLPQNQRGNQGHLMLTVVMSQMNHQMNPIRNVGPMRQHAAVAGDTLKSVAEKYKVAPEFLRRLNCMSDDDELQPGDIVLVNRKVRPNNDSTVEDMVFASGIEVEDLLDANDVQSVDQLDTKQGFQLPRPLQRNDQSTVVDFVDGGFF
jgi:LysM repeat protein